MDQYFRYAAARRLLRVGPLGGYLDTFAQQLADRGYARDTGQQQLRAMTFDDIDWRTGELTVRGKGKTRERLPLLAEVGQALASYRREARPSCATRHVFVTARAPFQELAGPTTVCRIVEQAIMRAGPNTPRRGAHLLRHSLATALLQRGASLQEIGDVLRHRHSATTQIYAKVDVAALQALAQPWPEEAP